MKNRKVIRKHSWRTMLRDALTLFSCLAMSSSTVLGYATWSGVDSTGYSHLVNYPHDFPSWDLTLITYSFDASFDADFPNPRIKDQIRLAFAQWDNAQGTPLGTTYSYHRANGWRNFGDIRSITLHELGHVLGVRHPNQAALVNRNWRPGATGLVAQADNGDEVMRSWINAGDYNHILSHDELDAFAFFYGHDIAFQEVTGAANITISTYTNVATNWAEGGGTAVWRLSTDHSQGARFVSGFVHFNDSSGSLLGFQTLGINWDYQNVGGKPTRSIRVRTTGTNNTTPPFHYDNPGLHTFNSFTASAPSVNQKNDLIFQWSSPSNGDIPPSDILHVGLELDVWDWTVVWARVGHPDGTESAASLLSFHEWSNTVVVGTPAQMVPAPGSTRLLAASHGAFDRTTEGGLSYRDAIDMGPLQRVLARGIRMVAPDVNSTVFDLALANVTGWNLTLADLNRVTLNQLQKAGVLEPVGEFKLRAMRPGQDFILVLDGSEGSLPDDVRKRGNFLILKRPDLLTGEVFVYARSTSETATVGTYALLGGPLNGRLPETDGRERPAALFAFGSRHLSCPAFSDPTIDYTMVYHGTPAELAYDPNRGWGYEVIYPKDSPYGERAGYGVFGPFDDSPNNRDKFPDACPEELYDSFIGAKDFLAECSAATIGDPCTPCASILVPEGIIFRVDVPNGRYRFVVAVGDADNLHAHRILAEDGGSGPPRKIGPRHVVLVSNFDQAQYKIGETDPERRGEGVFARVGFGNKIPPPGDGVFPSPQFVNMDAQGHETDGVPNSPILEVTQGYIRIHQLQGNSNDGPGGPRDGNGGDLVILELWQLESEDTTVLREDSVRPEER